MKVLIKVNKQHIMNGERREPLCCPIALAINERLKPEYLSSVADTIRIYYKGTFYHSTYNDNAILFASLFDSGIRCYDSQFELDLPEETLVNIP